MGEQRPATTLTGATLPDGQTGDIQARSLRTNAPATVPQRTPKAPDTPWGRLRGRHGWSLRELAARTGINPADLSRIERGIGGATPDQARRLLATFDEAGS